MGGCEMEHEMGAHMTLRLRYATLVGDDEEGNQHSFDLGATRVRRGVIDGEDTVRAKGSVTEHVMKPVGTVSLQMTADDAMDSLRSAALHWRESRSLMGGRLGLAAPEQRLWDAATGLLACEEELKRGRPALPPRSRDVEQCIFLDGVPVYFGNGLWKHHLEWYPPEVRERMSVAEWSKDLYPLTGDLLRQSLARDEELSAYTPSRFGGRLREDGTVSEYRWPPSVEPLHHVPRGTVAVPSPVGEVPHWLTEQFASRGTVKVTPEDAVKDAVANAADALASRWVTRNHQRHCCRTHCTLLGCTEGPWARIAAAEEQSADILPLRGPKAQQVWVDEAVHVIESSDLISATVTGDAHILMVERESPPFGTPLPLVTFRCGMCAGEGKRILFETITQADTVEECPNCSGSGRVPVCAHCLNSGQAGVVHGEPVICTVCDSADHNDPQRVGNPVENHPEARTSRPDTEGDQ